jgi:dihydrofolate synthase/folylpolyglutamate synthase
MKFGLRNMQTLLREAGNPERQFPAIHIAGTNGKGSTAAFLASIATEAGYRTALYTSPHLIRFTERIRINGQEIPEQRLVNYVRMLKPAIESTRATFFEATTCIAFLYFADSHVDLAVIETGLGGRLDATNILLPLISVITNVSVDHKEYLGSTLSAIAKEKAGIIKAGIPCVTAAETVSVLKVLRNTATRRGTVLHEARKLVRHTSSRNPDGTYIVSFSSNRFKVNDARIGMRGLHQVGNARLAMATIEELVRRPETLRAVRKINAAAIRRGLRRVVQNTGLRGRMDVIQSRNGHHYILDVAHNPAGVETLIRALPEASLHRLVSVFGVMKDKEYSPMLWNLARISSVIVPVTPHTPRALSARRIYRILGKRGIQVRLGGTVRNGIIRARSLITDSGTILITGSHYVVAEALEYLSAVETP